VCVYIHVYIYTYIYTYICTYAYLCVCVCVWCVWMWGCGGVDTRGVSSGMDLRCRFARSCLLSSRSCDTCIPPICMRVYERECVCIHIATSRVGVSLILFVGSCLVFPCTCDTCILLRKSQRNADRLKICMHMCVCVCMCVCMCVCVRACVRVY